MKSRLHATGQTECGTRCIHSTECGTLYSLRQNVERCIHSCARCCLPSFRVSVFFPSCLSPILPSSFLLTLCPTIIIPSCLHTNAHRHRSQKHWILIAASPAVSGVTDWLWMRSRECRRTRWLRHSAAMRDAPARRRFFSASWALLSRPCGSGLALVGPCAVGFPCRPEAAVSGA